MSTFSCAVPQDAVFGGVRDRYLLAAGVVAELSGLSRERIRQLDPQLQPRRGANGRRLYRLDLVEEFLRARAQKGCAK